MSEMLRGKAPNGLVHWARHEVEGRWRFVRKLCHTIRGANPNLDLTLEPVTCKRCLGYTPRCFSHRARRAVATVRCRYEGKPEEMLPVCQACTDSYTATARTVEGITVLPLEAW